MFKDPYCTVAEADTINDSSAWGALYESQKETALKWARVFLDSKYQCVADDGTDEYSNALKLANALLAQYHVAESLFTVQPNPEDALITSKKVKAGSVQVEKTFTTGSSSVPASMDRYPDATAALAAYCTKLANTFKIKSVIRS